MVPETIGRYKVLERVGGGTLGEIYRARDSDRGRTVALRVLSPAIVGDPARLTTLLKDVDRVSGYSHTSSPALVRGWPGRRFDLPRVGVRAGTAPVGDASRRAAQPAPRARHRRANRRRPRGRAGGRPDTRRVVVAPRHADAQGGREDPRHRHGRMEQRGRRRSRQ
ncbi:MAG: hypothetical protein QM736_24455 [Vicinamibacterales bacterium]